MLNQAKLTSVATFLSALIDQDVLKPSKRLTQAQPSSFGFSLNHPLETQVL